MSAPVLAIPNSTQNVVIPNGTRRSANFHPSIWGDYFLRYANDSINMNDDYFQQEIPRLKEQVKEMLFSIADKPSHLLNFIDEIQRLGLSHHLNHEIEDLLHQLHHQDSDDNNNDNDHDLRTVALRFRLLRQQGINVSCDVFNKFKNIEGNFKMCHVSDVEGILNMYEASHLRMHGEDILDEALIFATAHLKSITATTNLSSTLLKKVTHALNQPVYKGLPWMEARHYISIYEQDTSHNKILLNFAKLNFTILQRLHQKELSHLTMWWKDLNFSEKLPFARDRLVECYFWVLGVYFEPHYSFGRRILTKAIAMASPTDDIYDVYGTMEELDLLTDAIQRWDINGIHQLPEYMKHYYKALLDVYEEMEKELGEQGRSHSVQFAKEAMKKLAQSYFTEAKWLHDNHIPTMDEYMRNSLISSGYPMLAWTSFVGMGEIMTEDAFVWASNDPKIVRAASTIARLMNDIVSHKFEQGRGHVASAIECYMNQHEGTSEEQARDELQQEVVNAWKDINEQFLMPTDHVSRPILTRVLNLTRVADLVYKNGDWYTHAKGPLKDYIKSLLIDSVLPI